MKLDRIFEKVQTILTSWNHHRQINQFQNTNTCHIELQIAQNLFNYLLSRTFLKIRVSFFQLIFLFFRQFRLLCDNFVIRNDLKSNFCTCNFFIIVPVSSKLNCHFSLTCRLDQRNVIIGNI